MSHKCCICGSNEVDNLGGICELCAIGQDPYRVGIGGIQFEASDASSETSTPSIGYVPKRNVNRKVLLNGGASILNCDPYGNDMTPSQPSSTVQVYSAGQVPQNNVASTSMISNTTITSNTISSANVKMSANLPLATGVTKNITVDTQRKTFLSKWFRALFSGIPFTIDDEVTMFQVFPDYTGTSLNALGNACDQVIVYGKLNNGVISENNDVEVYGRRDSNNNIIAKMIRNKASGTTINLQRSLGVGAVWTITAIIVLLIAMTVMGLGVEGIIWTIALILCLTNISRIFKVTGVIFGGMFSVFRHRR